MEYYFWLHEIKNIYSKWDEWQRLTVHFPLINWSVLNLESKKEFTVQFGMGILTGNVNFLRWISLYMKAGEICSFPQTSNTVQPQVWWNICCLSGLRRWCVTLNRWFNLFQVWDWVLVCLYSISAPACILKLDWNSYMQIKYLILYDAQLFGVTLKCIAKLSNNNSSILRIVEWVLFGWKLCCSQYQQ